ncbi:unnamed protein product [Urochloa humidicola]
MQATAVGRGSRCAEAPERMVGLAPGMAGRAPDAEESSGPVSSWYSTVSVHSGSGGGAASPSTSDGATPELPHVLPSGLPTAAALATKRAPRPLLESWSSAAHRRADS